MSRTSWELIKGHKNFYVNVYRRGLTILIGSVLLNVGIGLLIAFAYFHQPVRDYYATSGITPPIKLNPMSAPNMSSQPLLEPDPPTENEERLIPQ